MREKISYLNSVLGILAALLILASLFAYPFPFARAVWIREVWGITGLIHAFLFVVIGSRITKASIPAPLAGIGIVLNYEILTALGLSYVASHRNVHIGDIAFFITTLCLGLLLIWIFMDIFKSLCRLRIQKTSKISSEGHDDHFGKDYYETDISALVISAVGYVVIFCLLYVMLSLDQTSQYGGLKILAVLISPLAFGGIGQEVDYYLQGKQTRFFCTIKSLTHVLALLCVLWVIYRRLPLSSVVI